jgi:hypothetical protein
MSFETWKGTWNIKSCIGSTGLSACNILTIAEVAGLKKINQSGSCWATGCEYDDTSETLWGVNCYGQAFTVHRTTDTTTALPKLVCTVEGGSGLAAAPRSSSLSMKKATSSKAQSKISGPCEGPDGGSWTAQGGSSGSGGPPP